MFATAEPSPAVDLRPLPMDFEHLESKWLPRLLWALEFARRSGLPPQSAADLCRILNEHGEQRVFSNNVSRAFRDYKKQEVHQHYWRKVGKCYVITRPGTDALEAALAKVAFA
jgi:hypothetical protein